MGECIVCREGRRLVRASGPFTRILTPDAQRMPYTRDETDATHYGQLKLLLSEIELLSEYRKMRLVVVYAGAAPGVHVPQLAELFPLMRFILIDPQPSAIQNGQYRNIRVMAEFMTDELAIDMKRRFGSDNLVLISDIRTAYAGPGRESDRNQQFRIKADMDMQLGWHNRMEPLVSMFKFRLPWDIEPRTIYPYGEIRLPVYGKQLTHETRLVVCKGAPMFFYNNRRYEGQMAYFNRVSRISRYAGGGCYDCMAFRRIIARYYGLPFRSEEVRNHCLRIYRRLREEHQIWNRRCNTAPRR